MNRTITVRLNDDIRKKLKEIKETDKRTISEIDRDSLESYLMIQRFKELRKKTLSYTEKAGFLTDEDIFEISK